MFRLYRASTIKLDDLFALSFKCRNQIFLEEQIESFFLVTNVYSARRRIALLSEEYQSLVSYV